MRGWLRSHLTYANVMVTILAFIVLTGGTAVALSGSNTVFSDDIVNNQVQSADVRDDTLSSGGLNAVDLAPNSVRGSEVQNGSLPPADSSNVVARLQGNSSVRVPSTGTVPYPLNVKDTWTQAADQTDFFVGHVTFALDPNCADYGGSFSMEFLADGQRLGVVKVGAPFYTTSQFADFDLLQGNPITPVEGNTTTGVGRNGLIFEPGVLSRRTMYVYLEKGGCEQPGGFTIKSLKINVIGFR